LARIDDSVTEVTEISSHTFVHCITLPTILVLSAELFVEGCDATLLFSAFLVESEFFFKIDSISDATITSFVVVGVCRSECESSTECVSFLKHLRPILNVDLPRSDSVFTSYLVGGSDDGTDSNLSLISEDDSVIMISLGAKVEATTASPKLMFLVVSADLSVQIIEGSDGTFLRSAAPEDSAFVFAKDTGIS
jgi:hypothetical protein